ncbi:DUF4240 domain-containing protein [Planococcus lenghuensis]|uniref:WGR domain-containing protein n=1 Tax=Planococcus lenghuensis TaxID=2213202 RepID=A0A1Q2KWV3_9BACL|nr:DUF4240 domain-containing protein [Planococcus lenghuensis]AQQ52594.1 hypothetical protein B0X71_05445 [Planococcus lenghuensis]
MERLLICQNGSSNKFWFLKVTGTKYSVTYGKIGTAGTVKVKHFESEEACRSEAERLIRSKMKKGYSETGLKTPNSVRKESEMDDALFWELIETSRMEADDSEEQVEWLIGKLRKRPVQDIIRFDWLFNQHYAKSYTSDLWAAAFIAMGGCSDDSFDYFRAWLISLGKHAYERAVADPESILPFLKAMEAAGEVPELEGLLYVAGQAYEEKTGQDDEQYFELYTELTGDLALNPEIELDWAEDDEEELRTRFPLLWHHFGETPLG